MKNKKLLSLVLSILALPLTIVSCGDSNSSPTNETNPSESINQEDNTITIAEAIKLANQAGDSGTKDMHLVSGKIVEISDKKYGAMTIKDETGELFVYGVFGKDKKTPYSDFKDKPVVGDDITLLGKLKTYNGEPEMDRGYMQSFTHNESSEEIDLTQYVERSIAQARNLEDGYKLQVSGTVAAITYANGMKPNGFYLTDNESSIYIYGTQVAPQVSVGNNITVAAIKDYYVLESEQSNANKHGYKGSCQLSSPILIENDNKTNEIDLSWTKETTIKEIMETPVNKNITTSIFKVNSYVKKVPGSGFTNYYFNDIDGKTGSYAYTSNNGDDFDWLDEFDGKICTTYLSPINCKATGSDCFYRFVPIKVSYDNYQFNLAKAPEYALTYHALNQFKNRYTMDPVVELETVVSSEILGFENLSLTYTSSNENCVYFEEKDGKLYLHTKNVGVANITIVATLNDLANGSSYSKSSTIKISVEEPKQVNAVSVAKAIEAKDGETITVKGVVMSSLVNRDGFYINDGTGIIAVVVANVDMYDNIALGDEIAITGVKAHIKKDGASNIGQACINQAVLEENYFGNHTYDDSFFKETSFVDLMKVNSDINDDYTTQAYVVTAKVVVEETQYYTNIYLQDPNGTEKLRLYCSSAKQYRFLSAYADQIVTVEIALCNWNSKNYYTGCVIAIVTNAGKEVNSLNFN